MSSAVTITDLTKTFGTHVAVDALSLDVPAGSVYGFIGPNGSGKTTTLRMMMNILYPDTGRIDIFGQQMNDVNANTIGYMPEERGLYKRMKVREILRFFARLRRIPDVDASIDTWLERFELTSYGDEKVETLSKGMSQKVQFMVTVITRPKLLLLDEPFSGLDPVNADVMREAILELRRNGTTIIFSTHDMGTAERLCDFIFMIYKGKKVLDGTLTSIQDEYGNDTIRVRLQDGITALSDIPEIDHVNDYGQMQELRIRPDADPNKILSTIISRTQVRSFDVVKPSLHDIFVRIAGVEATEEAHA
jgi:ABC-2 type transport system ATP-binding protein